MPIVKFLVNKWGPKKPVFNIYFFIFFADMWLVTKVKLGVGQNCIYSFLNSPALPTLFS